jgi:CRISPR-associated endonuclease/helicase Cas3
MAANKIPECCDIPTGLGKTSVLPIWLLALARQAEANELRLPRRLVYIVNRRTVVDQATDVVERMRARLVKPDDDAWRDHAACLSKLAETLKKLGVSEGPPLAVSTLRGELADNEEWKADPARPAIIIGTIDMIGSKLLFNGYGDGRYGRAHHAGLIGQDVLIVHDEAHLSPAFGKLLRAVAEVQKNEQERAAKPDGGDGGVVRPIRVLELSATSRQRGDASSTLEPKDQADGKKARGDALFKLEAEDQADEIVQERLTAAKRLHLHSVTSEKKEALIDKKIVEKIVELAAPNQEKQEKVLIYVRSPKQAQEIAKRISETDGSERIALLTGTIRGHERDQLMQPSSTIAAAKVIRHFIDGKRPERSVYLISTSAGEVGIDLDADRMVCDLTTLDAMIQRLGRVNRRGGKERQARVDVVVIEKENSENESSGFKDALEATAAILKQWNEGQSDGIDVSPGNLRELIESLDDDKRTKAYSPEPQAPPLTDILFDGWSLTSVQELPGVGEVAAFLHGDAEEKPETFVAWRREVKLLDDNEVTEEGLRNWFNACRVESRERLREYTNDVWEALKALLEKHRKQDHKSDFPVVLLDERGRAEWSTLSGIVQEQDDGQLRYKTVVLPVEAGGLNEKGMLDSEALPSSPEISHDVDVADRDGNEEGRQRRLCRASGDAKQYERLDTGESNADPPKELHEKVRLSLKPAGEDEEGGEALDLVLFVSKPRSALENPETSSASQTLEEHSTAIAKQMEAIAGKLGLPKKIQDALVTAAWWHDRGKDRPVWQRYACNSDSAKILAKAENYLPPWTLGGYRHEFGSLLEAMSDAGIQKHPERDLVLHLIAAHHGWARPHFEPEAFDNTRTTTENEDAALEVLRRFGRFQQRFGRWGLAWLESLLRCADIAVSKAASSRELSAAGVQEVSA